jgi:hypothetical protein
MELRQKESTRLYNKNRVIGRASVLQTQKHRIGKAAVRGEQPLQIRDARLQVEWEKLPAQQKRKILDKVRRKSSLHLHADRGSKAENRRISGMLHKSGKNSLYKKNVGVKGNVTGRKTDGKGEKSAKALAYENRSGERQEYRGIKERITKAVQNPVAAAQRAASQEKGKQEETGREQEQYARQATQPAKSVVEAWKKTAGTVVSILASSGPVGLLILLALFLLIILVLGIIGIILMVSFASMGSGSSQTVNLSPEVEAYRATMTNAASRYGMEEYVDLLLAVMMQESGGRGLDPMQAAEGAYNTRYPHVPNGIQDPAYSIECGVQELKTALELAGVTGNTDMVNIKIGLQGYNFGSGYIRWMERNGYTAWSFETSCEFAEGTGWGRRADPNSAAGPWKYGDQYYPEHVLQYYSVGSASVPAGGLPIPVYHQYDYQEAYGRGTIAQYGCGPSSFAMVVSYLKGETITPADVVAWCGNQYYVSGQGTSWNFFSNAASHYGIGSVTSTNSTSEVLQALKEGKPVISSQGPGLFTRGGHYIVLRGVTENGKVLVNDPNDNDTKQYQNRKFDMQSEIHKTSKCYWIFEAKK